MESTVDSELNVLQSPVTVPSRAARCDVVNDVNRDVSDQNTTMFDENLEMGFSYQSVVSDTAELKQLQKLIILLNRSLIL